MPSDDRISLALGALARPMADFRAAVAGAMAQANLLLAGQRADPAAQQARAQHELGPFARGRIDAAGFAAVFPVQRFIAPEYATRVERAVQVLERVLAQGEELFVVRVEPGGSLARYVSTALSAIGRAFGAILAVELIRSGMYEPSQHDDLFERLDFRSWTRDERRFAPPLVVSVEGADLHVGGLADFVDGREKIVLVVRGPCPPAPLVRLITPGTLVLQTTDGTGLERVATADGPAIAALVPEEAARFLHDPHAGREPWQRLTLWDVPAAPAKALGGASAWQMSEDLRQLNALAAAPIPAPASAGGAVTGAEAVDRLASWLLSQSTLPGSA